MPKRVRRSFGSCWTCRRRRVACDRALPVCSPCTKLSLNCEGYSVRLVWVDSEQGNYVSKSRRTLLPLATWAGRDTYSQSELEHLTDTNPEKMRCECALHTAASNPFGVLIHLHQTPDQVTVDSPTGMTDACSDNLLVLPLSKVLTSHRSKWDGLLLHHYVNHVASLMMPVDSEANPWRSLYPAVAMSDRTPAARSLHDALLSQSAFHLSVRNADKLDLARQYELLGTRFYCSALKMLSTSLKQQMDDYIAGAAVLHTLSQIEVCRKFDYYGYLTDILWKGCYAPISNEWRKHFQGVEVFLSLFSDKSPWVTSTDAWIISQSLALSCEIGNTGSVVSAGRSQLTDVVLRSVSQLNKFGYTIGANSDVMESISDINRLEEAHLHGALPNEIDTQAGEILRKLKSSLSLRQVTQVNPDRRLHLSNLHQRIFCNATIVHLHRTIFNVAPSTVQEYVSRVLRDTAEFINLQGGSISLWPVFVAAVEACTNDNRGMAEAWLKFSCELGINNRHSARKIVLEVWDQREKISATTGLPLEAVIVDWRQVQSRLGIDILLL